MSIKIQINFHELKNLLDSVLKKFEIWYLLLISFALHLFSIAFPSDGGKIFDEVYYVSASEKALLLQATNAEHMPLAKIVGAISIYIFGDYWFAWRIPIVIMGIVSLYAFYLIAKRFMSERYALFATAMLSFDVIFFIHSSIYVLDIPSICFGLIGIELYFAKKYKWSATSFGISFLMYELGLLFLGTILVYHIATHLKLQELKNKINWQKFAIFLIVVLLIGGGGLWIYDVVYKPSSGTIISENVYINVFVNMNGTPISTQTLTSSLTSANLITNPIDHLKFAWDYLFTLSTHLTISQSQYRPPWSWTMPIGALFNSPHYLTVVAASGGASKTTIDWVSQITPFVEYFFLPIVAIALMNVIGKKDNNRLGILLLSWIAVCYGPMLLLGIIAPTWTTFNYYIILTIPAFALGIPYVWNTVIENTESRKEVMLVHLGLTLIFFLFFFPVKLLLA